MQDPRMSEDCLVLDAVVTQKILGKTRNLKWQALRVGEEVSIICDQSQT